MKGTLVSWYKFIINQIVLMAFIFSTALPSGAFAQNSSPTPVATSDTSGGYVASEKFMNDKAEEEKGYKRGIVEMITIVVMALVLGVAPLPKRFEPSKTDCKMNNFGIATVYIAKAAAIVYLITELVTHYQFKKSGEAIKELHVDSEVDKGADEKSTAKAKDKQLTSFNRLKGLYQNEKDLFKKKLVAQGIMTTMFATALGVELGGMIACKVNCTKDYATATGKATGQLVSVGTYNAELAITTAAYCAPAIPKGLVNETGCIECSAYLIKSNLKAAADGANLTKVIASGQVITGKLSLLYAKEAKKVMQTLKDLNTTAEVGAADSLNKIQEAQEKLSKQNEDKAKATENDATELEKQVADKAKNVPLNTLSSSCAAAGGITATSSYKAHQKHTDAMNQNIQCCGSLKSQNHPNLNTPEMPGPVGVAHIQRDLKEPTDTKTKIKKFLDKMKKLFTGARKVKQGSEIIEGQKKETSSLFSPKDTNSFIVQADFEAKLEKFMKENSNKKLNLNDHLKYEKFIKDFYSKQNLKKYDPIISKARKDKDPYVQKLVLLLDALLVPSAHAEGIGGMITSPLLKVLTMKSEGAMSFMDTVQKFYDKWAQKAPMNRTIFWGVLTALAYTVSMKTQKITENLDERIKYVDEEKQKLISALSLTNQLDLGKGPVITDNSQNKFKGTKPISDDDLDPANSCYTEEGADPSCSCKSTGSCMNFPDHDLTDLNLPAMYNTNIQGLNKMASQVGQGKFEAAITSGSNQFGTNGLAGYNALKRKNKELQDKLNQLRKDQKQDPIDFDGMTKDLANGLAGLTNATIGRDSGGATMGPLSSTGGSSLDGSSSKDKSSNSASSPYVGSMTDLSGLAGNSGGNGSLVSDESLVAEELPSSEDLKPDEQAAALNNYEVNNNDITKTDENLFKILSSRYLRSAYPKLLKTDIEATPKEDPSKAPK
jgi:hypothetical protein